MTYCHMIQSYVKSITLEFHISVNRIGQPREQRAYRLINQKLPNPPNYSAIGIQFQAIGTL